MVLMFIGLRKLWIFSGNCYYCDEKKKLIDLTFLAKRFIEEDIKNDEQLMGITDIWNGVKFFTTSINVMLHFLY